MPKVTVFRFLSAAAFMAAASLLLPAHGQEPGRQGLKVVELFTSQACPNSPKADENMGRIADREGVLALSLPVTYWDYFGWEDTLAKPAFDARQEDYVSSLAAQWPSTPQMVINGRESLAGDDLLAVEAALAAADPVPPLSLSMKDADMLAVSLPPGTSGRMRLTFAAWAREPVTVDIGGGKNAGRRVTYHHVVRDLQTALPEMNTDGGAGRSEKRQWNYALPPGATDMACAVLLQDTETGEIVAAGLCPWVPASP